MSQNQSNNALAIARTTNQLRGLKAKDNEIEALLEHMHAHTRDRVGPALM